MANNKCYSTMTCKYYGSTVATSMQELCYSWCSKNFQFYIEPKEKKKKVHHAHLIQTSIKGVRKNG